jgi:phenylacetaldehyde dehydrogenase
MNETTCNPLLGDAAQAFIRSNPGMLIDGDTVGAASGDQLDVFDPSTGILLLRVPSAGADDIDRAVAAARRAFDGVWSRTKPVERSRLLFKLADLLEAHQAEFVDYEAVDGGKPIQTARMVDVPNAIQHFRYMGGWATKIHGTTIPFSNAGEHLCYTTREPVGVVGAIVPWNFPLLTAVWKLAPALAAGCTVVLKVAEQTPLAALRLGQLSMEAGFPSGVINVITGSGSIAGAALAAHADVDKIAFTGSTGVGQSIVRASAGNLKRLQLELGGKSPVFVFPDADLESAIAGVANGIFWNNGQCCGAGTRLYVHDKVYDKVVAGIALIAKGIRLGNSLDARTQMGPLISSRQLERVADYVQDGIREGAEVVAGGAPLPSHDGYFMQPTVLARTSQSMKIVREEIFGPVLSVQSFGDVDERQLTRLANDSPYGLAASIWTTDGARAHRFARQIRSGLVWINCHFVFDDGMPFGGHKQSGWGREMGLEGLLSFTEVKAVVANLN